MIHKKHINRHIIIISKDCIGLIMICAETIFTTRMTMETLTDRQAEQSLGYIFAFRSDYAYYTDI